MTVNTTAQAFAREALKPDPDRVNRARSRAETLPAGDYRAVGWWVRDETAGQNVLQCETHYDAILVIMALHPIPG